VAERLLLDMPDVKSIGRRTGRAELDEHAEGVHSSDLEIDLKPEARPKLDLVADIRGRLAVLPVNVNVGQPISHRLDHMLSGVRAEIALKIFGEDLDTLRALAEGLRQRLADIPGIADLQVEKQVLIPQLEIRVDYNRAALYGVQPARPGRAAEPPLEWSGGLARGGRLPPFRRRDAPLRRDADDAAPR
jgi:Cu/Ag efflux pump CusA